MVEYQKRVEDHSPVVTEEKLIVEVQRRDTVQQDRDATKGV